MVIGINFLPLYIKKLTPTKEIFLSITIFFNFCLFLKYRFDNFILLLFILNSLYSEKELINIKNIQFSPGNRIGTSNEVSGTNVSIELDGPGGVAILMVSGI